MLTITVTHFSTDSLVHHSASSIGHTMLAQHFNSARAEIECRTPHFHPPYKTPLPIMSVVPSGTSLFTCRLHVDHLPSALFLILSLILLLEKQEEPRGDINCLPSELLVYLCFPKDLNYYYYFLFLK